MLKRIGRKFGSSTKGAGEAPRFHDPDPKKRAKAIDAFCKLASEDREFFLDGFVRMLKDKDAGVRAAAAAAFPKLQSEERVVGMAAFAVLLREQW